MPLSAETIPCCRSRRLASSPVHSRPELVRPQRSSPLLPIPCGTVRGAPRRSTPNVAATANPQPSRPFHSKARPATPLQTPADAPIRSHSRLAQTRGNLASAALPRPAVTIVSADCHAPPMLPIRLPPRRSTPGQAEHCPCCGASRVQCVTSPASPLASATALPLLAFPRRASALRCDPLLPRLSSAHLASPTLTSPLLPILSGARRGRPMHSLPVQGHPRPALAADSIQVVPVQSRPVKATPCRSFAANPLRGSPSQASALPSNPGPSVSGLCCRSVTNRVFPNRAEPSRCCLSGPDQS